MNINLTKRLVLLLSLFAIAFAGRSQSYSSLYYSDCYRAKEFFAKNKDRFEIAAKDCGLSAEFLFAVVAPELTQFSSLSNRAETYSLKVFYVQGGSAYNDFSIGVFQMKPSFIELMEREVAAEASLKAKYSQYLFAFPDSRQARVERIDRLSDTDWQINYLALFCVLVNKKFASITFATEEEQLRFYAAAYNTGFNKTEEKIREIAQKYLFPHFSRQKFRYADIALWFYKEVKQGHKDTDR